MSDTLLLRAATAADAAAIHATIAASFEQYRGKLEPESGAFLETVEGIAAELARSHSSVRSLAEALGIPRKTLHDKLRKHGLNFADGGTSSHTDDLD